MMHQVKGHNIRNVSRREQYGFTMIASLGTRASSDRDTKHSHA